ncbi:MAG: PrgI family protein [Clostridia bacterium]|nr:PrgI family protein [Clostridia bacterium]
MEIKINREIRNYTESMFFGLSMRQFFFSVIGVGIAVLMYFLLRPYFGTETLSWVCMLTAAPFVAMGFITYNGMTAEQFAWTWIRSKFIEPQKVKFECDTFYHEAIQKQNKPKFMKKGGKPNDEIT